MRMIALSLTIILITTFTTIVFSENIPPVQLQGTDMTFGPITTGNIFYQDPENKILLIDFKEVSEKLVAVKVSKEKTIILEDKVNDLADDSIYEVDLNQLEQGDYLITLITANKNFIENPFSVE